MEQWSGLIFVLSRNRHQVKLFSVNDLIGQLLRSSFSACFSIFWHPVLKIVLMLIVFVASRRWCAENLFGLIFRQFLITLFVIFSRAWQSIELSIFSFHVSKIFSCSKTSEKLFYVNSSRQPLSIDRDYLERHVTDSDLGSNQCSCIKVKYPRVTLR